MKKKRKFENMPVVIVLFMYWFILVIWQNINGNYISRTKTDLVIKLIVLVLLTAYFLFRDVHIKKNNLLIWLIFTIYFFMMMVLMSDNLSFSTIIFYIFPVLFSFLTLVCHSETEISKKYYLYFLNLFIIIVLYMTLYSVFFQTEHFTNIFSINNAYGNELSSFLTSNHEYGMNLVFGIIASFICYKEVKWKGNKKLIYVFIIALFGINLILTFSRTSYLALVTFFTIYLLLSKRLLVKGASVFIALVVIYIIFSNGFLYNYIFKILLKSNNDAGRFVMWESALKEFLNFPIINQFFGKGYEQISSNYSLRFGHDNLHNMFAQNLVMWGFFGFSYFIGILFSSIRNGIKIKKYDKEMFSVFIAMIFCSVAIMITNTTCIMTSSLNSYMLTIFTIIIPKYVINSIYNSKEKNDNYEKT